MGKRLRNFKVRRRESRKKEKGGRKRDGGI
jgi:hypothetical protein